MSTAYVVQRYGTDSSGRAILMNRRMKAAFDDACELAGVTPTIVQGAYMSRVGGGADASAGTHESGGCLDTRTWDLTIRQRRRLIRAARSVGWAVWFRDQRHGMDEHCHWVLLGDEDAHPDARWQMVQYKAGFDGLASVGRDYHWRPSPIPTYHYTEDWFDMATKAELREIVEQVVDAKVDDIASRVRRQILHESDVFPNDPKKDVTVNDVLARSWNRGENR